MRTKELDAAFRGSGEGKLYLFLVNPEERLEANLTALKKAINYRRPFIFVMARYPYQKLQRALDEIGALDGRNSFIDAKTQTIAQDIDLQQKNVMYMKSPQNLVNINTSISVASQDGGDGVVVIDSFSTLLSYNPLGEVSTFLQNVKDRMTTLGTNAVLFQDFKEDEWPPQEILEHVDEVVSLYSGELEESRLEKEDGEFRLTVPTYVVESLGWSAGQQVSIEVEGDGLSVTEKD